MALSESEARKLTEELKVEKEHYHELFLKAHEGKAWKNLGYYDFRSWALQELGISESVAYELLRQGKVIQALVTESHGSSLEYSAFAEKSSDDTVTQREILPLPSKEQSKELGKQLKEPKKMAETWKRALKQSEGGKPTAKEIKALVEKKEELLQEAVEDPTSAYNNRAPKDPKLEKERRTWEMRKEIKRFQSNVKSIVRMYEEYNVPEEDREYFVQEIDELREQLSVLRDLIASPINMDDQLRNLFP